MKRKILSIVVLLVLVIGLTGCGSNKKLDDLAKKINNSKTVKNYKEYDYIIKASASKDTLTITSKVEKNTSKVEFKLKDNILTNENLTTNDLVLAMLMMNAVGQTYGYKDGEISQNMNAFPEEYQKYSLKEEGLELKTSDEKISIKIDLSKKIPLIDMNSFYLKPEDFDIISDLIKENKYGNQSGKLGNISYDVFINENENTIQIGQDEKLEDSAYKSILSALEVMYGKETSNRFQELYPKFVEGKKTVEEFTIEKDYKIEDQDDSMFKDTEIVLVTIKNMKENK